MFDDDFDDFDDFEEEYTISSVEKNFIELQKNYFYLSLEEKEVLKTKLINVLREHVVYMQYVNSLFSRAEEERLLPVFFEKDLKEDLLPPEVEPSPEELLKELEPIYLASSIYQASVVAQVSEQAARNNAMKNATDNADEILDKLKLEYNKARQGAITQEITEVISGAGELE